MAYNRHGSRTDLPAPAYVGRTRLWPVDRLDAWREAHPSDLKIDYV
ncbi:hypothetical protein [Streptomyces sp. NPDC054797]